MLAATDPATLFELVQQVAPETLDSGGPSHVLSFDSFRDRRGQQWLIATFKPIGGAGPDGR